MSAFTVFSIFENISNNIHYYSTTFWQECQAINRNFKNIDEKKKKSLTKTVKWSKIKTERCRARGFCLSTIPKAAKSFKEPTAFKAPKAFLLSAVTNPLKKSLGRGKRRGVKAVECF